jgi:hypothetical protein
MAALDHFARDFAAHGAIELAVFQAVAIDAKIAPIDLLPVDDFDIVRLDSGQSWVT